MKEVKNIKQALFILSIAMLLAGCGSPTKSVTSDISDARWRMLNTYKADNSIDEDDIPTITDEFRKIESFLEKLKAPDPSDVDEYSMGYTKVQEAVDYFFRTFPDDPEDNIFLQAIEFLQEGIFYLEESEK